MVSALTFFFWIIIYFIKQNCDISGKQHSCYMVLYNYLNISSTSYWLVIEQFYIEMYRKLLALIFFWGGAIKNTAYPFLK